MSHNKKTIKTVFGVLSSKDKLIPGRAPSKRADGYISSEDRYLDWGYDSAKTVMEAHQRATHDKGPAKKESEDLKDGMLLTVFNTISKGDVAWSGVVNLEHKSRYRSYPMNPQYGQQEVFGMWVHGLQDGMDAKEWASMFFNNMPATLERDGKKIHGTLEPFFETGTEGVIWSLSEFGKSGYDGLNCLKKGDKLTVYSKVTDGDIAWQSDLSFETVKDGLKGVKMMGKDTFLGEKVDRLPKGISRPKWRDMFFKRQPIKIELKK